MAAKAHRKAMRPWFKKKRFILPLALIALVVFVSVLNGGNDPAQTTAAPAAPASSQPASEPAAAPTSEEPEPAEEPEGSLSVEEQNAVGAAQSYLEFSAFSRKGLIEQLSSDAGDGYPKKVATKAVDSLDVDYKEQAAKAAKNYLEVSNFSRQGMIEQLSSDAGDGYTKAQAEYGAKQAGL